MKMVSQTKPSWGETGSTGDPWHVTFGLKMAVDQKYKNRSAYHINHITGQVMG